MPHGSPEFRPATLPVSRLIELAVIALGKQKTFAKISDLQAAIEDMAPGCIVETQALLEALETLEAEKEIMVKDDCVTWAE